LIFTMNPPFSPSSMLDPPSCISREEACCIKTALALILTKKRLEERVKQGDFSGGFFPSSSLHYPWMNDNSTDITPVDVTSKVWAHLDHMMKLAMQQPLGGRFASLISHLASQLESLTLNDELKRWLKSYLVALQESTANLFRAILCKSALKHELAGAMLPLLTDVAKQLLENKQNENITAHGFYVMDLMDSCFLHAPTEIVRASLQELTDYTLPAAIMDNPAAIYYAQKDGSLLLLKIGIHNLLHGVITALAAEDVTAGNLWCGQEQEQHSP
jgi:hypothetical protein